MSDYSAACAVLSAPLSRTADQASSGPLDLLLNRRVGQRIWQEGDKYRLPAENIGNQHHALRHRPEPPRSPRPPSRPFRTVVQSVILNGETYSPRPRPWS